MYWNTLGSNGGLFKASFGDFRSSSCKNENEIPSVVRIIADEMTENFVLEPSVFIYFTKGDSLQYISFDLENNGSIDNISPNIEYLESFDESVVIVQNLTEVGLAFRLCEISDSMCPTTLLSFSQPIQDILTFRRSKQPLPGMHDYVCYLCCLY